LPRVKRISGSKNFRSSPKDFCNNICQTRKSPNLFDHLVGAGEKGFRDGQPIAFAVLRLMTSSNLVGCLTGSGADCIGDSKAG
jgi:hypothetical protein